MVASHGTPPDEGPPHEPPQWHRRRLPAPRVAGDAHARGLAARAGTAAGLHGRLLRRRESLPGRAAAPGRRVHAQAGADAFRPEQPGVGGRRGHRPRPPRAAHHAAQARQQHPAAAVRGAAALHAAGPQPPAVGVLRHRRPAQRRSGAVHQGAPRTARRPGRRGPGPRHPRPRTRRAAHQAAARQAAAQPVPAGRGRAAGRGAEQHRAAGAQAGEGGAGHRRRGAQRRVAAGVAREGRRRPPALEAAQADGPVRAAHLAERGHHQPAALCSAHRAAGRGEGDRQAHRRVLERRGDGHRVGRAARLLRGPPRAAGTFTVGRRAHQPARRRRRDGEQPGQHAAADAGHRRGRPAAAPEAHCRIPRHAPRR